MKQVGCPYHDKNSHLSVDEYFTFEFMIQKLFSDEEFIKNIKAICIECKQDSFDHVYIETHQMNEYKSRLEFWSRDSLDKLYRGKRLTQKDIKTTKTIIGGVNTALHVIFCLYAAAKKLGVPPEQFRDCTKKLTADIAQLSLQGLKKLFLKLGRGDAHAAWDSDFFCLGQDGVVDLVDTFDFDSYRGQCPAVTAKITIDNKLISVIKRLSIQMNEEQAPKELYDLFN